VIRNGQTEPSQQISDLATFTTLMPEAEIRNAVLGKEWKKKENMKKIKQNWYFPHTSSCVSHGKKMHRKENICVGRVEQMERKRVLEVVWKADSGNMEDMGGEECGGQTKTFNMYCQH